MDCRGQGGRSEDTGRVRGTTYRGHIIRGLEDAPDNLLYRQIYLDTVQLAHLVMEFPEVDSNRIGVVGWSQGGALAVVCAALEPRIRRCAAVYPFLGDYRRAWEMDLGGCLEEIVPFFETMIRSTYGKMKSSHGLAILTFSTWRRAFADKSCGGWG